MSTISSSSFWAHNNSNNNNIKKQHRKGQRQQRRFKKKYHLLVFLLLAAVAAAVFSPVILFNKLFHYNNNNNNSKKSDVGGGGGVGKDAIATTTTTLKQQQHQFQQSQQEDRDRENDYNILPQWMKDYFVWHNKQRLDLIHNHNNNYKKNYKFLILRCTRGRGGADDKNNNKNNNKVSSSSCGGLSDRLKALPLLIYLAAKYERIFMIYWDRPCQLEEFLVPPSPTIVARRRGGGIDWRVPEFMKPIVSRGTEGLYLRNLNRILEALVDDRRSSKESLLFVKIQDQHGGSEYYNNQQQRGGEQNSRAHRKVFGPLFRTLFEPSPGLAKALDNERRQYPLLNQGGTYDAVHLRALYVPPLPPEMVPDVTVNAINCASQFHPTTATTKTNGVGHNSPDGGGAIFFASDSIQALQVAKEYGEHLNKSRSGNSRRRREIIVIDRNRKNPLHLDKATSRNPQDYYDVFLDMYHFANSRCISHGQGGFGRLGVLLSHNASCLFTFFKQGQILPCEWKD